MKTRITAVLIAIASLLPAATLAGNRPEGLMTDLVTDAHLLYRDGLPAAERMADITDEAAHSYTFAAIRSSRPTFGWIVPDCGRGTHQRAYRIIVADNRADAEARRGNVWDSGTVRSAQSAAVPYGGGDLQSDRLYFWSVRVLTDTGGLSEWSDVQPFRTAERTEPYAASYRPQRILLDTPRYMRRLDPRTTFADFGRASFASLDVTLASASGGDTVYVAIGEALKEGRIAPRPHGTVRYYRYPLVLRKGRHTYRITPAHDPRNTGPQAVLMPDYIGEVAPFRYCQIEGYSGHVDSGDIVRRTAAYPFDRGAARFASDDPVLNAVWELCKYSIEATSALGIYIDGDRERIPYEADAVINQLGHYAVDREYAMARRTSEYLLRRPTWPTEWIMQALIIAWNDYLHTGDLRSIEANYDLLAARTLAALTRENGLVSITAGDEVRSDAFRRSIRFDGTVSDIVDWPRGSEDDGFVFTEYNAVVNAYHYHALRLLARMAAATGRDEEARDLSERCRRFRDDFNRAFLDEAAGAYRDGIGTDHRALHSSLFALAFGLVPPQHESRVMEYVRSRGMACSVYASQFLMDAIYDAGDADYALHMLTKRDKRSWYNMLRAGTTITFEAWDDSFKANQDWNHAWGAAPANIIPRRLAGVRPIEPAAATIEIRPQISALRHVSAAVPTIRGTVEVDIDHGDGQYRLRAAVPPNTDARIVLPALAEKCRIMRDGRRIRARRSDDGRFLDAGTVPSGEYVFTIEY